MANANVVNGYLIPDVSDVKEVILKLKEELQNDAILAAQYKLNPRQVLGARGLCQDVQNEWLDEDEMQADCTGTCACSGCCVSG